MPSDAAIAAGHFANRKRFSVFLAFRTNPRQNPASRIAHTAKPAQELAEMSGGHRA